MAFNRETFSHFWQHIEVLLGNKVDKAAGKGLSTNDYTNADKVRLAQLTDAYIKSLIDEKIAALPAAEEGAF